MENWVLLVLALLLYWNQVICHLLSISTQFTYLTNTEIRFITLSLVPGFLELSVEFSLLIEEVKVPFLVDVVVATGEGASEDSTRVTGIVRLG